MDKEIVISVKTVLVALLMIIGLYVVYQLAFIFGLFAVALLIVFAMEPLIKTVMKGTLLNRKIPRGTAVIFSYILFIVVVALALTVWLPPFFTEAQKLIKNFPKIVSSIQLTDKLDLNLSDVVPQASKLSGNLLTVTLSVFTNLATLFSIIIMSIYMSLDWPNLKKRFASLFPSKAEDTVYDALDEIETNLGRWIKGELFLMLIVGLASFIGFVLLDVDYPLALGLIAGFLEAVPMFGPLITAVIAVTIALATSPVKALGVIAVCIVVQQLENNLLVPKIMQKVSGFSPLIILFSLLIGGRFFGVVGVILAVPTTMTLGIVIKRVFRFMR